MRSGSVQSRLGALQLAAAAAAALLAIASAGAGSADLPDDVQSYAAELKRVSSSKGRTSLEQLFGLASNACIKLDAIVSELNDTQLGEVRRKLPGLILRRDGAPVARASATYFADLARRKGTPADRAFFENYARTEPDTSPRFPAYVRQTGPQSRCTTYDGRAMARLYSGWLAFRTKYHDDYSSEAQGEIDNLDAELLSGICACGSADQTAAGLQAFVDALPDLPRSPKIRERIALIRAGRSNFRFNCRANAVPDTADPPAAR